MGVELVATGLPLFGKHLTIHFNFDRFYLKYAIKEEVLMKGLKKILLLLLTVSLIMGSLYSAGWAGDTEEKWVREDPVGQGWSAVDLIFARPLGVFAGVAGTTFFIVSLPFTIPSGGVRDAADMFIVKPFKFSFTREFPDGDI